MREVVIAGYLRYRSIPFPPKDPARDVFGKLRADELLAKLLPEVAKRTGVQPEEIDRFYFSGCATRGWRTVGLRRPFPDLSGQLPKTIAAKFVDQQCGSSMAAIHVGFMEMCHQQL